MLVARAVHDPHAALADPLQKAVMTKDFDECWFRRHFSRLGEGMLEQGRGQLKLLGELLSLDEVKASRNMTSSARNMDKLSVPASCHKLSSRIESASLILAVRGGARSRILSLLSPNILHRGRSFAYVEENKPTAEPRMAE